MLTLDELRNLLRESAGVDEEVDLDGEILDTAFDELGYDSIAVIETVARITRDHGVRVEDDAVADVRTPRELLDLVNAASSVRAG
ncbi:acyl carrier protein [Amycolatopsis sp. 195334CR]|uniref:acyl carrier protein n=1 Tax=Amycolatopsis sp. 195334CR TaxID=2814588 RepID=UPI001A8E46D6|nr:acyl carrier protein [Amycolatopsis sp. 195334CR]MBN6040603.1 acyl carrier protein [Amycolatopsis sp. 195334CR]